MMRKYGGAEPEVTLESVPTLDETSISPEIEALINKGIQQQQVLLRTGTAIKTELTGGGSADPDDLEQPEDTLDIQAIIDYTDIIQKNQATQTKLARTIQLGKKIAGFLNGLQSINNEGQFTAGQKEEDYVYQNIMLTMVREFPDLIPPEAIQEYNNARTQYAASDPNRYDKFYNILNTFSPIPDEKVNWKRSIYTLNAFDLRDLINNYNSVEFISSKFPLIPYPTISTDDPDNLTSIYLQQVSNLVQQNDLLKAANEALMKAKPINWSVDGGPIYRINENTGETEIIYDTFKIPIDFLNYKGLVEYFKITDPTVLSFVEQFNTSQRKTFNTDDDVEFFKDKRVSKYNWSQAELTQKGLEEFAEGFGRLAGGILFFIPGVSDAIGGLVTAALSPLAALGYAIGGNGAQAVVMLDTFAKTFPGVNVIYSVSKILDKLVKKEPLETDDLELLRESITETALVMAGGIAGGLAKGALTGMTRNVLRRAALAGIKSALKEQLITSLYQSSQEVLEIEANKVFAAHAVEDDESHTADENVFYWISDIGTGNNYFYYLFPDKPIDDEVMELVNTPALSETGASIFIIPPASIFIDALRDYEQKDPLSRSFRKLAFQASDYFVNERYRIQLATDAFFKKINTQSYQQGELLQIENFNEYIEGDYLTMENIIQIRKDGVDPESNELKLPLVIPPPTYEFSSAANNQLITNQQQNLTSILQKYVDQENTFVDAVITYIRDNIESIKAEVLKELFEDLGEKGAELTSDDFDTIKANLDKSVEILAGPIMYNYTTPIYLYPSIASYIRSQINEIKEEAGVVLAEIPSGDEDIRDQLQNECVYYVVDLLKEELVETIEALKIAYSELPTDITQQYTDIQTKKTKEKILNETIAKIRSDHELLRQAYASGYFNDPALEIVSKGLAQYLFILRIVGGSDFMSPQAIIQNRKMRFDVTNWFANGYGFNPAWVDDYSRLLVYPVPAYLQCIGQGYNTLDEMKVIAADEQITIDNVTKNFNDMLKSGVPITSLKETSDQVSKRVAAWNAAMKPIYILRQTDLLLINVPDRYTQFYVDINTFFNRATNVIDWKGYSDAKRAEVISRSSLQNEIRAITYTPKTVEDLTYNFPDFSNVPAPTPPKSLPERIAETEPAKLVPPEPPQQPKGVKAPEEEVEEEPPEEEPPEEEEEPPEEEKLPNKTPQQIADYKMALFNSLRSVQTYLLAQQKVYDNEEISDLYDIILNSNSETSADIKEAIIGLYNYQEKRDNYYTIRHYVHPIMAILKELGDDSMDEMIQEEDQRQIEELTKQLKNYKYSNSKFNEFIKGDVSVLDVLKQFQDIAQLVKAHPDITNDDLTEEESKISLNKKYVPFQPSIIQQKKQKKKKTKSLPRLG